MKWAVLLLLAASAWAQSLGDVVRADRERPKKHAAKVITNDDLRRFHEDPETGMSADLFDELAHMRVVLREICSDPRSDHGRKLSDYDKRSLADAVKPLRARIAEFERIEKDYTDTLAALDRSLDANLQSTLVTGRPFTEGDLQKGKSIQAEHQAKKAALLKNAETDLKGYPALQKELESIARECPEAAKTVPD